MGKGVGNARANVGSQNTWVSVERGEQAERHDHDGQLALLGDGSNERTFDPGPEQEGERHGDGDGDHDWEALSANTHAT